MVCQECGAENANNAFKCARCSAALQQGQTPPPITQQPLYGEPMPTYVAPPQVYPYGQPQYPTQIPNYMAQAILVTLFCCWPSGIVAIIFASQVNSKLAMGDIAGAMDASNKARTWCWVSVGVIVTLLVICLLFFALILILAAIGASAR
jgi:hypothetical protein